MPTGCICYLVRSTEKDLEDFIFSLISVRDNYLNEHPCDIIAFREKNLTEPMRKHVLDATGVALRYVELEFHLPEGITLGPDTAGYRHMCHFFANDIFHREELKPYTYYMRLDTDSSFPSPISFDIFNWMHSHKVKYGYITTQFSDCVHYAVGLWPHFAEFVKANPKIKTYKELYTDIPELRVFYTNFEVCKLSWFRKSPWVDFFSWVDKAQGIYLARWGDHTIRYAGVNLFMKPDRIKKVPIHYHHQFEFGRDYATVQ